MRGKAQRIARKTQGLLDQNSPIFQTLTGHRGAKVPIHVAILPSTMWNGSAQNEGVHANFCRFAPKNV